MFCKSCDCLVCPSCISETHNGHGLVAIREGFDIQIDKLKKGQKNIRTNIDNLKKRKIEVEDIERSEHSKLENTMKKFKTQYFLLKNELEKHTDKLKSEIIDRWEDLHESIKKRRK